MTLSPTRPEGVSSGAGTSLALSIGGLRIALEDRGRDWAFTEKDPHAAFVVDARGEPDIALSVERGRPAPPARGERIYSTDGGLWNLDRENGTVILSLGAPAEGGALHRVARMDGTFTRGEVLITPAGDRPGFHPYPLRYPLDELLVINHLSRGRGAIFHASGMVTPAGAGCLFVGRSGAGKSTMSRLWSGREGFTILSDDRVILRPEQGEYRLYGTPWHGDAEVASPRSAPLERIFLLEHAAENRSTASSPAEAARAMMVNCFAPFYDAGGMEWTLALVNDLIDRVPVFRLRFLPDPSVVAYLLAEGGIA